MPRWEVRAWDRVVVREAPNWLVALGLAVDELRIDADLLFRMACDLRPDGTVQIREPASGTSLTLRRVVMQAARPTTRGPSAHQVEDIFDLDTNQGEAARGPARFALADGGEDEAPGPDALAQDDEDDFFAGWDEEPSVPPSLVMPTPMSRREPEPEMESIFDDPSEVEDPARMPPSVALMLLERGMEIAGARRSEEAADLALGVLRQVVPAESGAVLIPRDGGLVFVAAHGPRAPSVLGRVVPSGAGISGYAYSQGKALIVHNAGGDIRHFHDLDDRTGYRTQAVLAVPLRDGRDEIHGCLELLNPPTRFQPWHLEAARTVAVALAEALRVLTR